jgi:hypothetical protein
VSRDRAGKCAGNAWVWLRQAQSAELLLQECNHIGCSRSGPGGSGRRIEPGTRRKRFGDTPGDDALAAIDKRLEESVAMQQTGGKRRKVASASMIAQEPGALCLHMRVRGLSGVAKELLRVGLTDSLRSERLNGLGTVFAGEKFGDQLLRIHACLP